MMDGWMRLGVGDDEKRCRRGGGVVWGLRSTTVVSLLSPPNLEAFFAVPEATVDDGLE